MQLRADKISFRSRCAWLWRVKSRNSTAAGHLGAAEDLLLNNKRVSVTCVKLSAYLKARSGFASLAYLKDRTVKMSLSEVWLKLLCILSISPPIWQYMTLTKRD